MKGPGAVLFDVNGNPVLIEPDGSVAVTILDGYVTLAGSTVISVSNFPATQVVSGSVSVSNFPAFPATQVVSGSVSVSNLPVTQPISGSVTLLGTSTIAGTVSVSNFPAFPATQVVSGTVSVSNFPAFPAIQAVSQSGAPWSVQTNKSSTSAVTQITPSTTVQTLLASNVSRVYAHMTNGSNKDLY